MKKECGFTLSELMIVAAVLSAIAIPIYSDNVRKTKLQEAVDTTGAIKDEINTYTFRGGWIGCPPHVDLANRVITQWQWRCSGRRVKPSYLPK
jgi:prepilin-type N-terminal cleavage/methylation domain-containing protein